MIKTSSFTALENETGRVDKIAVLHEVARSVFSLDSVKILINGKEAKKSSKCRPFDKVELTWEEEIFDNILAQDIPLDVLYEDDDVLVINK
ncbi:MAG: hypothetical protein GX903_07225, partial [Spirochaetales bacterium]|nr:hypothetical protein [Spirochaetales bacterium]